MGDESATAVPAPTDGRANADAVLAFLSTPLAVPVTTVVDGPDANRWFARWTWRTGDRFESDSGIDAVGVRLSRND